MILTCPSCTTRYLLDPAKLGPAGRTVRCGKCSHTWHQEQPRDMPKQVEPIPFSIEPRPIPPGSNLPAFPPRPKRQGSALGWAALLIVVMAVLGGGYVERERIALAWPPAGKLYAMLGVLPPPVGEGLKIREIATKRTIENNVPVLKLEGEVANLTRESREVPALVAVLRDARQRNLQQWTFKAAETKLLPGEVARFSTSLKNPTSEATDITVDFLAAGSG